MNKDQLLLKLQHPSLLDGEFQEIVAGVIESGLIREQEFCDAILISRNGLKLWMAGKNLPHKAMRPSILKWLRNRLVKV